MAPRSKVPLSPPPGRTRREVLAAALLVQAVRNSHTYPLLNRLIERALPLVPFGWTQGVLRRERRDGMLLAGDFQPGSRNGVFVAATRQVLEELNLLSEETLELTLHLVAMAGVSRNQPDSQFKLLSLIKREGLYDRLVHCLRTRTVEIKAPSPDEDLVLAERRMKREAQAEIRRLVELEEARREFEGEEFQGHLQNAPGAAALERRRSVSLKYFTAFLLHQDPGIRDADLLDRLEDVQLDFSKQTLLNAVATIEYLTGIPKLQRSIPQSQ